MSCCCCSHRYYKSDILDTSLRSNAAITSVNINFPIFYPFHLHPYAIVLYPSSPTHTHTLLTSFMKDPFPQLLRRYWTLMNQFATKTQVPLLNFLELKQHYWLLLKIVTCDGQTNKATQTVESAVKTKHLCVSQLQQQWSGERYLKFQICSSNDCNNDNS